jgi:hypothetical protein
LEFFRGVAKIAMQVAEAMDHAHQEGVIHRDRASSETIGAGSGQQEVGGDERFFRPEDSIEFA